MVKEAPTPNFKHSKTYFRSKKFDSEKEMLKYVYENRFSLHKDFSVGWWTFWGFFISLFVLGSSGSFFMFFLSFFAFPIIVNLINSSNKKELDDLVSKYLKLLEEEKEHKLKFVEKQNKKGLFEFKGQWYEKKKFKKLMTEDLNSKINSIKETNEYLSSQKYVQGHEMVCLDCSYIWNIKKPKGIPAKCPSCNSKHVLLGKVVSNNKKIQKLQTEIKDLK